MSFLVLVFGVTSRATEKVMASHKWPRGIVWIFTYTLKQFSSGSCTPQSYCYEHKSAHLALYHASLWCSIWRLAKYASLMHLALVWHTCKCLATNVHRLSPKVSRDVRQLTCDKKTRTMMTNCATSGTFIKLFISAEEARTNFLVRCVSLMLFFVFPCRRRTVHAAGKRGHFHGRHSLVRR